MACRSLGHWVGISARRTRSDTSHATANLKEQPTLHADPNSREEDTFRVGRPPHGGHSLKVVDVPGIEPGSIARLCRSESHAFAASRLVGATGNLHHPVQAGTGNRCWPSGRQLSDFTLGEPSKDRISLGHRRGHVERTSVTDFVVVGS